MAVEVLKPEGLVDPGIYAQVAVATGSTMVFVAGQVGQDAEGKLVGDDLASQLEQAIINVSLALEAAGGTLEDVVRMTTYVVGWSPDKMPAFGEGMARAFGRLGIAVVRPTSLIGVEILFSPDILVEVEVTAVLD